MSDLIDRQAAIDAFGLSEKTRKYGGDHSGYNTRMLYEIQDVIESLPSVEPERKTGKWIKATGMMPPEYHGHYECSECGTWAGRNWLRPWKGVMLTRFCPGCGAKMEGIE